MESQLQIAKIVSHVLQNVSLAWKVNAAYINKIFKISVPETDSTKEYKGF